MKAIALCAYMPIKQFHRRCCIEFQFNRDSTYNKIKYINFSKDAKLTAFLSLSRLSHNVNQYIIKFIFHAFRDAKPCPIGYERCLRCLLGTIVAFLTEHTFPINGV